MIGQLAGEIVVNDMEARRGLAGGQNTYTQEKEGQWSSKVLEDPGLFTTWQRSTFGDMNSEGGRIAWLG